MQTTFMMANTHHISDSALRVVQNLEEIGSENPLISTNYRFGNIDEALATIGLYGHTHFGGAVKLQYQRNHWSASIAGSIDLTQILPIGLHEPMLHPLARGFGDFFAIISSSGPVHGTPMDDEDGNGGGSGETSPDTGYGSGSSSS